jgi:hypothetical protein
MGVHARTWFTPKQKAELWERWKGGQCVADIARALKRRNKSGVYQVLALNGGTASPESSASAEACGARRDLPWHCVRSVDTADRTGPWTIAVDDQSRDKA